MDIAVDLAYLPGKPFNRKCPTPQAGPGCCLPVPSTGGPACQGDGQKRCVLATIPTVRAAGADISGAAESPWVFTKGRIVLDRPTTQGASAMPRRRAHAPDTHHASPTHITTKKTKTEPGSSSRTRFETALSATAAAHIRRRPPWLCLPFSLLFTSATK